MKHLLVFEHQIGNRRDVTPVVTEYTRAAVGSAPEGQYEFFRARAVHSSAMGSSFHGWHNQVSITICHLTKQVKIGPTGQLIMSHRGRGLGPALMACVITWLKERGVPEYTIAPGFLSSVDASSDAAREQRNRFYMAFGFVLSKYDGTQTGLDVVEGSFTAENVGALTVPDRYQDRLKPWFDFEDELKDERESGVRCLAELKAMDQWTHNKSSFGRWLLRIMGWPVGFATRHLHKRKPWEPEQPGPRKSQAGR
ncbi:GNAT family N-acetyltransferase [Pseudomonas sp. P66]|uniref:GNAT family N-acetyltransferase n=1 Tax=Pseudomonas arcuscaelestis TaxID=2710591 RepID=A0ABS2BYG2_9PSED|nr:GNAT family N-acetyltransferase [Pseudomonas arcuscaelestis]MBM5458671.1 GNAT family N-acetyltransferase [Pseudomonas arcuscaelestis]